MDPTDFTNSAFVTPQQTEQLRQYVTQLQNAGLKPDATSWSGVLAHALMGGAGALGMNQANQQQRQMLQQGQQGLQNTTDPTVRALLGQGFNPQVPQQGAPASASGQPAQQPMSGAPRGIRNNNPGNIEDGPFAKSMPGYAGTDGRFAIFQNPQAGQQAMDRLLTSYGNRGINTPQAIAAKWAPAGDAANNPTAYASTVAGSMGVHPNTPLNMNDPNVRAQLAAGMTRMENGIGGQQPMQMAQNAPNNGMASFYMNPSIPQGLKDHVMQTLTPQQVTSEFGQPATRQIETGIRAQPIQGNYTAGYKAPFSVSTPNATVTGIAPQTANGGAGGIDQTANQAMGLAEKIGARGAALKGITGGIESDVQGAQAAFPIMQNLDMMADEINKHGNNMNWGPSAAWMTDLKRIVANHAPGLMSADEISGLAAQENVRKITALLSTAIGRQTGNTDLSLLQGRESVPGEHNSQEGNKAIIDMLKQQVGLNARFVMENYRNYGQPGFDPLGAKADFYKKNPIINPLTHNPITVDLSKGEKVAPSQAGWSIIR